MGNDSSTQRFKTSNFIFIGKTGTGKSSTLNSITRDDVFLIKNAYTAGTKKPGLHICRVDNRVINIVDTPGLFHPNIDSNVEIVKFARDKMCEAFEIIKPGGIKYFDALVLVLDYRNRFTNEEKMTIAYLKTIFGQHFVSNNCIIVMTHGDNFAVDATTKRFNSFKDWCQGQAGGLRDLFNECNFRVVLFNNQGTKDEKRKSSSELFSIADQMRLKYNTTEFFKHEEQRKHMVLNFCLLDLRKHYENLTQLLYEDYELVQSPRDKLLRLTEEFENEYAALGDSLKQVHESAQNYIKPSGEENEKILRERLVKPSITALARLCSAFHNLNTPMHLMNELKAKTDLLLNEIHREAHGTNKLREVEDNVRKFQRKLHEEALK